MTLKLLTLTLKLLTVALKLNVNLSDFRKDYFIMVDVTWNFEAFHTL